MLIPDIEIPVVKDKTGSEDSKFLALVKRSLNMKIRDPTFGVKQLSESVKLSPTQTNMKLTALTGYSSGQLINYFRIHFARRLLLDTDDDINEVARLSGYSGHSSFSRSFLQFFHLSPSRYREQHRKLQQISPFTLKIPLEENDYHTLLHLTSMNTWFARFLIAAISDLDKENITVDLLAAAIYQSAPNLNRKMKLLLNVTPQKVFRNLKLQYACEMLSQGDTLITDIAYRSGFFDHAHFSRCFKQVIGCTPSSFQKVLNPDFSLSWLKKN